MSMLWFHVKNTGDFVNYLSPPHFIQHKAPKEVNPALGVRSCAEKIRWPFRLTNWPIRSHFDSLEPMREEEGWLHFHLTTWSLTLMVRWGMMMCWGEKGGWQHYHKEIGSIIAHSQSNKQLFNKCKQQPLQWLGPGMRDGGGSDGCDDLMTWECDAWHVTRDTWHVTRWLDCVNTYCDAAYCSWGPSLGK